MHHTGGGGCAPDGPFLLTILVPIHLNGSLHTIGNKTTRRCARLLNP